MSDITRMPPESVETANHNGPKDIVITAPSHTLLRCILFSSWRSKTVASLLRPPPQKTLITSRYTHGVYVVICCVYRLASTVR